MKNILFSLVLLAPLAGHSVETKKCPQQLVVNFERFETLSDSQLGGEEFNWDLDQIKKERDALKAANPSDYQNVVYRLVEKVHSQCRYLAEGQRKQTGTNETRLFTRQGRNILRISLQVGKYNYWTYHNVSKYSVDNLTLTPTRAVKVLGYYSDGNLSVQMAWALTGANVAEVSATGRQGIFAKIPEASNKKFLEKLEEVSTEWADGNISTGTSSVSGSLIVSSHNLKSKYELSQLSVLNYKYLYKHYLDEEVPANSELTTTQEKLTPTSIKKVAKLLALGNDYDPDNTEGLRDFITGINSLTKFLGHKEDVVILTSSLYENPCGCDEEDEKLVSSVLIVGTKTRKALQIFVVEGTM